MPRRVLISLLVLLLAGATVIGLIIYRFVQQPDTELIADPVAVIDRVQALQLAGRPVQALYAAEAGAADAGWSPQLLHLTGDLWSELGDLRRAVAYWEAAVAADPAAVPLLRGLANAYLELGAWPQAADSLERLLAHDPTDALAQLRLALLQAPFNPQAAEANLRAVVSVPEHAALAGDLLSVVTNDPADPLISMRVGLVLVEHGLWSYAELAFEHAATVAAPYAEALAYAGFARDNQGKDGSDLIAQAVALEPNNARVRHLQGLHYRRQGNDTASLYTLTLAAALDPENPAYYAELGTGYRLAGDLQRAEYWLQTAVVFSNNDPRFQEMLALFYAEEALSLTEAGYEALTELTDTLPDDPDVRAGHGWALHTLGETEQGLAEIDAALAAEPGNIRALYYKARILLDLNDAEAAGPLLRQVAATDSEFADLARRALTRLGN